MLYATTRSDRDVYTAQRVLTETRAPDGGLYVPFRETRFSREQLELLEKSSVLQNLAALVNLLFKTRFTDWDMEFSVGRRPIALVQVGRRTAAGELWHNTGGEFSCLAADLTEKIRAEGNPGEPGLWARIGTRAGCLYSLFALMKQAGYREDEDTVDVSVAADDLEALAGAWFARSWGLPIGRIICGCREDSPIWELCHSGQLRTGLYEGRLPDGLEVLIYCCGGRREVQRYLEAMEFGSIYKPGESTLRRLRQGLFVSVVSDRRLLQTVASVCSGQNYIMDPHTAYPYAGMLDYRAETGESGWGLILADRSPYCDLEQISRTLGTTPEAVRSRLAR